MALQQGFKKRPGSGPEEMGEMAPANEVDEISPLRESEETALALVSEIELPENPSTIKKVDEKTMEIDGRVITLDAIRKMESAQKRVKWFAIAMDWLGIDAVAGFIFPEVGDLATSAMALYPVIEAAVAGVPRDVLKKMMINIVLDTGMGLVPVAGDVADAIYMANSKNSKLFREYIDSVKDKYENNPEFTRKVEERGVAALSRAKIDGLLESGDERQA